MTTGGLSRECLVYGWQSVKACLDATAKGYKTVVMPGEYFYFDMRQTPQEEGHDWAAVFDAKKVFGFDFTEKGFSDEQMRNVVGLQAKPTFRTSPKSPTIWTTCVFRASARSPA